MLDTYSSDDNFQFPKIHIWYFINFFFFYSTKLPKPAANEIPDDLELQYEKQLEKEDKKTKSLLPIKTKDGIIQRTMDAPEGIYEIKNKKHYYGCI